MKVVHPPCKPKGQLVMEALKAPPPKTNPKHLQVVVASSFTHKKNTSLQKERVTGTNGVMEDSGTGGRCISRYEVDSPHPKLSVSSGLCLMTIHMPRSEKQTSNSIN